MLHRYKRKNSNESTGHSQELFATNLNIQPSDRSVAKISKVKTKRTNLALIARYELGCN